MQIRELDLKELYTAYEILKHHYKVMSYEEFENLIYDMRHIEYKMFGVFHRGELECYAGVSLQTNLYYKRHIYVHEIVGEGQDMMMEYLRDYARVGMCENLVISTQNDKVVTV